jgi:hypothetical protein
VKGWEATTVSVTGFPQTQQLAVANGVPVQEDTRTGRFARIIDTAEIAIRFKENRPLSIAVPQSSAPG